MASAVLGDVFGASAPVTGTEGHRKAQKGTERHCQRVLGGSAVPLRSELTPGQRGGHSAVRSQQVGKGQSHPPAHEQTSLREKPLFPAGEYVWDAGEAGISAASGVGGAVKIRTPV